MNDTITPHLGLDYLMPEQAQKHVTLNDALRRLDGLVQLSVINRNETAPPQNPKNGDRYLVAAAASGAWQRHDNKLALFEDTGWAFVGPQAGWTLWDEEAESLLVFDGTIWKPLLADAGKPVPSAGAQKSVATSLFQTDEAIFDLARDTGDLKIPSHITLLGVSAKVLDKITGPNNWTLGTDQGNDRFGKGIMPNKDTEVLGPADPPAVYWDSESIVLTPGHGSFTGGRVAVAIHYIRLPTPQMS